MGSRVLQLEQFPGFYSVDPLDPMTPLWDILLTMGCLVESVLCALGVTSFLSISTIKNDC